MHSSRSTTVVPQSTTAAQRPWVGWVDEDEVADAVRRAATGDRAAWDAIVNSYSRMVWSVAMGHRLSTADAAEVVQTTWVKLLENLHRIREPERLGGWLATTARREALRLLRQRGREVPTDEEARFDGSPAGPTPEDVLLDRERDRRLWRAFQRLSERCRTLLHLVIVVAPPYAEVAAALDMPIGSIGPTRARCLDRLRRLLADDEDDEQAVG